MWVCFRVTNQGELDDPILWLRLAKHVVKRVYKLLTKLGQALIKSQAQGRALGQALDPPCGHALGQLECTMDKLRKILINLCANFDCVLTRYHMFFLHLCVERVPSGGVPCPCLSSVCSYFFWRCPALLTARNSCAPNI